MTAEELNASSTDLTSYLDNYSQIYLKQYWPEVPDAPGGWADNAVLMLAYQDAMLAVRKHSGHTLSSMLDISTGPALAPLLAMMTCIENVQLSDFNENNRESLLRLPVTYWRNYVPMLIKTFDRPERQVDQILNMLDVKRRQNIPLFVDLLCDVPFAGAVNPLDFAVISMQFVADGIVDSETDYFRCLGRVTEMVNQGSYLVMSAIVDSSGWQLGDLKLPSPNVSEEKILGFLGGQGFSILDISRSIRQPELTYSGGWIVLSAVKDRT